MALAFALGSTCFLIGPCPGYVQLVGDDADAITFFVGSILFTTGGALQTLIAWPERRTGGAASAAFSAAAIQSIGTLFFNISTFAATRAALDPLQAHRLVWAPDLLGSIAFIVASWLAWVEVCHRWFAWRPHDVSWLIVAMNLGGSIAFLISSFAAYVNKETGEIANLPVASLGTFLGAVGFFVGALLLVPEMRAGEA